jgi:hypothetical protein
VGPLVLELRARDPDLVRLDELIDVTLCRDAEPAS